MKRFKQISIAAVLLCLAMPLLAAENDSKAFGQFQELLEGLEQKSFEMIRKAIDQTDMRNRVFGYRPVADQVREGFSDSFWEIVETNFLNGLPQQNSNAKATLVQFIFEDGQGRACVRFNLPNYEYMYHLFDLRHDRRGRLKIVDWYDSRIGQSFSEEMGDQLIAVVPSKAAIRQLLSVKDPTDLQLFQMTEILKAIRDNQATRFFEIYDNLDDQLKREPLVAKQAAFNAHRIKDSDRFVEAVEIFVEVNADDPDLALMMADFYVLIENYEKSYEFLLRYHQYFSVNEGALPAKLSALALVTGKLEQAEEFALEATIDEPSLELGWWSLLRARAASKDYEGALQPLTSLEDLFGHRLDGAKLRRDKFRAFGRLAKSEEFREWRASRN